MVGGGRRGHVAAAWKTGASESWRATAEEAERGGAMAGGRYTARRGCVCVCARCVCAVEHWHLVLVPARVNLLGAFRRLPLAQELGLHTQWQAQARSRLCVAAVAVLYCGREHGACSAGCGHSFQPPAPAARTVDLVFGLDARTSPVASKCCACANVMPPMRRQFHQCRWRTPTAEVAQCTAATDRIGSDKIG